LERKRDSSSEDGRDEAAIHPITTPDHTIHSNAHE